MRKLSFGLVLGLGITCVAAAQQATPTPMPEVVPGSYIVRFQARSFDLEEFRIAVHARRPAAEVAGIIPRREEATRADQAAFCAAVEGLGGRVTRQFWIINGAAVENLGDDGLATLADLPNVAFVEADRLYYPANNTARNATHHEADQANQRRDAGNAPVIGSGITVAILDTGLDAVYGGSGIPNPAYYPGGNQANATGGGLQGSRIKEVFGAGSAGDTEDQQGHGSHVSGSVASDYSSYRGIAPGAWLMGVKITRGTSGGASGSALIAGWQHVAARRVMHNVAVANNSFSGSPSLNDSIQRALDNTAYNADVLICCAAGNNGSNTASSQNAWNGLAVGSINKNSLSVSSFSGRGPLDNFGRSYPDITTVGASVVSIRPNSSSGSSASGTSMASPMAAGGAALLRQAVPTLSAIETKAIMLNTTKHTQNDRNNYGLGVMDCDAAVAQALAGDYLTTQLTSNGQPVNRTFTASTTGPMAITAVWMHPAGTSFDNVDLRVYQGATLIASDLNTLNSYESVDFVAQMGASYRVELTRVGNPVIQTLDVAIAGFSDIPVVPPTLANISPARTSNGALATITLDGSFDRLQRIDVGGMQITDFIQVSPTQLTFTMPRPAEIGATLPVTVTNAAGTSNPLSIRVDGTHPIEFSGVGIGVRGFPVHIDLIGDAGWDVLMFVSPDLQPSVLPGIVNLGIANNFATLFSLGSVHLDGRGATRFTVTIPNGIPTGLYHFQGITYDVNSISAPLEASNVFSVNMF